MTESQADKDEKERLAKKYELHEGTVKSKDASKAGVKAKKDDEEEEELEPVQQVEEQEVTSTGTKKQASAKQLAMLDMIKKQAAEQAWGVDHPDPLAKNPLPITRAERRKLIKDEIQRLAQADKPVYYQRRLW